ncbi:MAG: motility-associated protein [Chloroflexota bacterium]
MADSAVDTADARRDGRFEVGPVVGVVLGTLAVFGAFLIEGGDLRSLILPSPLLIVVGGTLGALLLAHPASDVMGIPGLVGRAFTGRRSVAGAQLLRDAGTYAIITSLIALVMGAIVVLGGLANADAGQLGHSIAVGIIAPLYALLLALVCNALGRRLRGTAE